MLSNLRDDRRDTPPKVVDLKRIQFGAIRLDVPSGEWRMLKEDEIQQIKIVFKLF